MGAGAGMDGLVRALLWGGAGARERDKEGTMTKELDQLRQLAANATPGPWALWLDQDGAEHMNGMLMVGNEAAVIPEGETWVEGVDVNPIACVYTPEDRAHIAAFDPPTVLALIGRVEAAEREAVAAKSVIAQHMVTQSFETSRTVGIAVDEAVRVVAKMLEADTDRRARDAEARAEAAEAAVQRVRAKHAKRVLVYPNGAEEHYCAAEENSAWPCDTIRALDGGE